MVRAAVLAVVIGAVSALLAPVHPSLAAAETAIAYEHPVDADIIDPFRPPPNRFGSGNRGVKYDTASGDEIRAAAAGTVVFAGQAGWALHVTVAHDDGRLTSYSGVGEILVAPYARVTGGQVIARTAGVLHVGVREHGEYVDPESLFGATPTVRLVPESPVVPTGWSTPGQEAAELRFIATVELGGSVSGVFGWFARGVGHVASAAFSGSVTVFNVAAQVTAWAAMTAFDGLVAIAPHVGRALLALVPIVIRSVAGPLVSAVVLGIIVPLAMGETPPILLFVWDASTSTWRVGSGFVQWWRHRGDCTPGSEVPEPPDGRRVAVLVGGLDSTSTGAAIGAVQTADLGYRDEDVIGFSYAGGRTPGRFGSNDGEVAPDLAAIEANAYGRSESSTDLASRGVLLADLLTDIAASSPGTPVDLYAHSQGGLVTRLALAELAARPGGPEVIESLGLVATIASPHHGADLATLSMTASDRTEMALGLMLLTAVTGSTLHPYGTNIGDLDRRSELISDLAAAGLPDGPTYLSLGGRGDLVVLEARSNLDGARHTTVPVVGGGAHGAITSDPRTTRELALGLADQPPTCQGLVDFMIDTVVGEGILLSTAMVGIGISAVTINATPWHELAPIGLVN